MPAPSIFRRLQYIAAAAGLALAVSGAALAQVPTIIDGKDVLPYLNQIIDWQRRLSVLEVPTELPRLLLIRNTLHEHAAKAVASGFNVAHAIATTLPAQAADSAPEPDDAAAPKTGGIENAVRKANQQVRALQAQLDKAGDAARRKSLDGQIKLAQEHLTLIKTIAASIGSQSDNNDTLDEQIQKLSDTVPEADGGSGKQPSTPSAAASAAQASEGGMAGIAGDLYGYIKEKQEIKALRNETLAMLEESRGRSRAMRDTVQSLMKQGAEIGQGAPAKSAPGGKKPADDKPAPAAAPAAPLPPPTYDDLLADMKQISTIAVPVSELNLSLDATARDLAQWSDALSQQIRVISRRLAWRVGAMGSTIIGLCLLSVLFGRATRRYVLDERRQVHLRTFRRIVLIFSILIILFVGFFTDFTSLATFAGLITAGLAVALQTLILSVVAFFHFFGRFGIRVGDRITISGVTGNVMQIGMVRFYLMEVDRSDVGFIPTGRVVGFPNSILFQPTPFFHQVPGTNFVWSEINLTLDPTSDHVEAHKKVHDVVTRVYADQRNSMRLQETALDHFTRFKVHMAEPQMYLRITGSGLIMTIRYAVQREQEADLHLKMTEELLSVIKKDPQLKFVGVG